MNILHVTNWYPNVTNPKETLFVKEHFDAISELAYCKLWHLQMCSSPFLFRIEKTKISDREESLRIHSILFKYWRFTEWVSSLLLLFLLVKERANKKYDIINIHEAYPLLSLTRLILGYIKIPICITEHWTAFHFNFNLPKNTRKLDRIKKIFSHRIPVLGVSRALVDDIKSFSGYDFPFNIVPNIIDDKIFYFDKTLEFDDQSPSFFMVNYWRKIKSPLVIMKAFHKFIKQDNPNAKLRIGGYGEMWPQMETYVKQNRLEDNIILIGKMDKKQIADEMRMATAFLHASSYETFSIVTVEALMCGTPVVVSKIPAIEEYLTPESGVLVQNNNIDTWYSSISNLIYQDFNRPNISKHFSDSFSRSSVSSRYFEILNQILHT